ncbi:MAG: DUF4405 domain-containing protein [Anaerolineales bacterium]|nr:DUF4405 domain-containing protein [Anaerolineales bacterium]
MTKKWLVSPQTRNNWLVNTALLISALAATLSGIYFLFLPVGGYQGGRNPYYGIILFFERHTWEDIHTWGGVAMIVVAAVHIPLHWRWIVNMTKRAWKELSGQGAQMNPYGRFNLWLNVTVGVSFLLTALSGLYFLFVPGRVNLTWLFTRHTWDLIHTWSGIVLILAAVLHFAIHWRWVVKVTGKVVRSVFHEPARGSVVTASTD